MPEGALNAVDFLRTPSRQSAVVAETEHRPWPLPERPWTMAQTWEDLLFAHWALAPDELRPHVPEALELETFDSRAYLGVTPFRLTGLRLRGTLPLPGLSSFLELNVRTYVTYQDRPGIWFFSLDAASPLAVEAARRTYKLPYFHARMSLARWGAWLHYSSARTEAAGRPFVFEGRYRPMGDAFDPQAGTLEHFLTERYCLYAVDAGRVYRAEIHHSPWELREAEAELELNTMAPDGIELGGEPSPLHYGARQDVVIWPLRACDVQE